MQITTKHKLLRVAARSCSHMNRLCGNLNNPECLGLEVNVLPESRSHYSYSIHYLSNKNNSVRQ